MGCVEDLKSEILIRDASLREYREYVRSHFSEWIDVEPGFKIFDVHVIGVPPIAVGLDGDFVIFPYTALPRDLPPAGRGCQRSRTAAGAEKVR